MNAKQRRKHRRANTVVVTYIDEPRKIITVHTLREIALGLPGQAERQREKNRDTFMQLGVGE